MTRILHVFTSSKFVPFVRPILSRLLAYGYEPHVITSAGPELASLEALGVHVHTVEMSRKITPLADLRSLFQLRRVMRRIDPELVHLHTPKGGLLGALAATSLGLGPRIYQMHGTPWLSAEGFLKGLYWCTEATSSRLAHQTLAVSPSLLQAGVRAGFLRRESSGVLGGGSAYGVDTERFPHVGRDDSPEGLRARLGLGAEVCVLGFAGRYIEEKGLAELGVVLRGVRRQFPSAVLLLAGAPDGPVPEVLEELRASPGVIDLGYQSDMLAFYRALDVFLLPSHREGLSTVLLEAMSVGVPAVGARTVGIVDVIDHGRTGYLAPKGDGAELSRLALEMLSSPELCRQFAEAGAEKVRRSFRTETIVSDLLSLYTKLGAPPPRSA
ncbi:MAG: hypothetical protein B6A08_05815 [Sorangiineae bacterium NIC37A_2]|jgi:glycosyltransferase involved in cell wall biosynthesis|nr:MAG: hypothetical protein B6A08_05815 [Sorangiineae bacterium NIC37A_2]